MHDKKWTDADVEAGKVAVLDSFKTHVPRDPKYKRQPCMLRVNGRIVKTTSGKALWNCPGHAKAALRNHLESPLWKWRWGYANYREFENRVFNELLESGAVEIVPL